MEVYAPTSVFTHSKFATHITFFGDENLHRHTYFEIVYVLTGAIEHICNGQTSMLSRGSFLLLRPNDTHKFRRFDADCTHRDIMIPKELFKTCCDFLSPTLYNTVTQHSTSYESRIDNTHIDYFEDLLNHINTFSFENAEISESMITSVVISLLTTFLRKNNADINTTPAGWFQYLLNKFSKIEFLQEGIPAIISDIAYNHVYICRVFKNTMHCTMTEYLNQARLQCAENYLRFSSSPVSVISENVGFSSPSYFNALFKKKYGMSPHKYRLSLCKTSKEKLTKKTYKAPPSDKQ